MTVFRVVAYLRTAAGLAWSALRGRPCACEFCRAHRQFIRDTATAYRTEVRALAAHHEGRGA